MASIQLSTSAYSKILLHAHKHPSKQVLGILVGQLLNKNSIQVTDSFPISHGQTLLPMLEIALVQIDLLCKETNRQIIGVYSGNELRNDESLKEITLSVANKIHEVNPSGFILQIDNKKLSVHPKELALQLFSFEGKTWKQSSSSLKLTNSLEAFQLLEKYFKENASWNLFDFDDHLDDLSKDWFNESFNSSS